MTKARLYSTVAIVLTFGMAGAINGASAQSKPNPEPAPAAQQNAPPAKIAPSMKAGEPKNLNRLETTGQSPREPSLSGHVQGGAKSDASAEGSAETSGKHESTGAATKEKTGAGLKADSSSDAHKNMSQDKTTNSSKNADSSKETSAAESASKSGHSGKSSTTGQGSAAGAAKLTTDQRTQITTVIKKQNVKPVHVNFSINVGTRVPPSVHYYPLPTEVVTIYPEWRGFDYILVGDQILVIDPDSHEIVAILEA